MTPQYKPDNKKHVTCKEGIEIGNGLPTLVHQEVVIKAMEDAGFEVEDFFDANEGAQLKNETPWYATLQGQYSISGFRMTHIGRMCTHTMVWTLETLGIAPRGTVMVSSLLNATALDLVYGGEQGIFTPSFFFIGKKVREAKPTKEIEDEKAAEAAKAAALVTVQQK